MKVVEERLGPERISSKDTEYRNDDVVYQAYALQRVSRTFALTIPMLPLPLRTMVGNAYLLCRIIDTIEDSTALSLTEKEHYSQEFIGLQKGMGDPALFATELCGRLAGETSKSECELVRNTTRVLRLTKSFPRPQQASIQRCVEIMADGMVKFQRLQQDGGLRDLHDLDGYCYCVAGVVGEMLTDLFCEHSPEFQGSRVELNRLAVSFGQALQMTNILKDHWDDRSRRISWIPSSILAETPREDEPSKENGSHRVTEREIRELVGLTYTHLEAALRYVMLIPRSERGIRRFCLSALGMSILTLRKIAKNPGYHSAGEVKISRSSVKGTVALAQSIGQSNLLLKTAFAFVTARLPRAHHAN